MNATGAGFMARTTLSSSRALRLQSRRASCLESRSAYTALARMLGPGTRPGPGKVVERADQELRSQGGKTAPQLTGALAGADGELRPGKYVSGVEPLVHQHDGYAASFVAGEDRALDGRRAPPTG